MWFPDVDEDDWGSAAATSSRSLRVSPVRTVTSRSTKATATTTIRAATRPIRSGRHHRPGLRRVDGAIVYTDDDDDGYGTGAPYTVNDDGILPLGVAEFGGDCNDDDSNIAPNAYDEPDDMVDNDCNGFFSVTIDDDADGWGASVDEHATDDDGPTVPIVSPSGDCDDTNPGINPRPSTCRTTSSTKIATTSSRCIAMRTMTSTEPNRVDVRQRVSVIQTAPTTAVATGTR